MGRLGHEPTSFLHKHKTFIDATMHCAREVQALPLAANITPRCKHCSSPSSTRSSLVVMLAPRTSHPPQPAYSVPGPRGNLPPRIDSCKLKLGTSKLGWAPTRGARVCFSGPNSLSIRLSHHLLTDTDAKMDTEKAAFAAADATIDTPSPPNSTKQKPTDADPLDPSELVEYEIPPEETRALLRTLDWHIAPVCMVLYLIAFLDRANIGR